MNRSMIAGAAAGSCAGMWLAVHGAFFPAYPWGTLPLLLALLPFAAFLFAGRPLLLRLGELPFTRWIPPAAALLLPLLFWLMYEATNAIACIGGSYDVFSLLPLLLLYALFAGIAVDAVTLRIRRRPPAAEMFLGAAIGFLGLTLASDVLPLPLLWLLHALPFFFLEWKTVDNELSDSERKPLAKGKRGRFRQLPEISIITLPLLLATGTFAIGILLRTYSEMPFIAPNAVALHLGFLFLSAGLGLLLGKRLPPRSDSAMDGLLPSAAAAVLLLASWSFADGGFSSMYIAYYEGLDSSLWSILFPLFFLHIPVLLGAASIATMSTGIPPADEQGWKATRVLINAAAVLAGLIVYAILPETLQWQETARGMGVLLALIAAWQLARGFVPGMASWISAGVTTASIAAAILQPTIGFYGFLNPSQFRVTAERPTFAGTLALLQSRDYDDPFHALLWRSTQSLTQSSRLVQSALYRMGHIPMFMAPESARVLMLGLASTIPLHGVLMHDPATVECVEPLGPSIMLSRETKRDKRPRPWLKNVVFHAERIESYVRRSDQTFDVIISAEPFAVPGSVSQVFTPATMRHVAGRLSDNGVFAQWLPLSRVGVDGLRSVAVAVGEAFPHIELWISGPDPDNAMAGILAYKSKPASGVPARQRLDKLFVKAEIMFHFRQIEIGGWADLAAAWSMDNATLRAFASGSETPGLFSPLPVHSADRDPAKIWTEVRSLFSQRSAPASMRANVPDSLFVLAEQAFGDRTSIFDARVLSLQGNDQEAAKKLSEVLQASPRNNEARAALAAIFLRQAAGFVGEQKYPNALQLLNSSMALVPLNTYLLRLLMISAFQTGDREAAGLSIDGLKKLDPLHAGYRDNQATIRAQQGATNDALLLYENAITLDPSNEEFYCNMASFHFSQQRVWEAVRVLDQAKDKAYYPAKALYLQGLFYSEQGRYDFARESYEGYLRVATPIDPMLTEVEQRLERLPERR
jgi:Tfp pilus assembly protein PilF